MGKLVNKHPIINKQDNKTTNWAFLYNTETNSEQKKQKQFLTLHIHVHISIAILHRFS